MIYDRRHPFGRSSSLWRRAFFAILALLPFLTIWPLSVANYSATLLSRTTLIMDGTGNPVPSDNYVERMMREYVYPTSGTDFSKVVPVITPMQGWPATHPFNPLNNPDFKRFGVARFNPSISVGVENVQTAMTLHQKRPLLIAGFSQGAIIVDQVKRNIAARVDAHPGSVSADTQFTLWASPTRPNGGLFARFPGVHIPILNLTFSGAARTDTPFKTVDVVGQYDGYGDFPLYPTNIIATVNAVMGMIAVHPPSILERSLDPRSPAFVPGTYMQRHGDTTYFFIPTHDLPLLAPVRAIGSLAPLAMRVMEPLLQAIEAPLRHLIEMGYDRNIPFGQAARARMIPPGGLLDHVTRTIAAMEGFARALAQGMQNAWASVLCGGCKPPLTLQTLPPGSALVTDRGNLPPRDVNLPPIVRQADAVTAEPHSVHGATTIPPSSPASQISAADALHQPTSDSTHLRAGPTESAASPAMVSPLPVPHD